MNRILISILLVTTILSCTNNSYTLRGTTENPDLNGVVVTIQVFDGEEWSSLGEVAIKNQQFIFRGVAQEPTIAILSFNYPEGRVHSQTFVLENARINFNITEDMQIEVSGRSILQVFNKEVSRIIPQEFVDSVRGGLLSEAEWQPRFENYQDRLQRLIRDFSIRNVNTAEGTFVFLNHHRNLSSEAKIAILDLMNETTKKNTQIQHIIQQIETELRVASGQPFIDFTLPTPAGEMLSLSDVVGNYDYVLLHFWASWCGPCIRIFPEMIQFYAEHGGESFEIFSVSLDNNEAAWKNAIENHNLAWYHVSDLKMWDCEVRQLYAVSGIPTRFLIDRNGKIVGRNMSFEEIAELLR